MCSIHAIKINARQSSLLYKYPSLIIFGTVSRLIQQIVNRWERNAEFMNSKFSILFYSWMRDRSRIVIDINLGWIRFGWEMLSCIVFTEYINLLDKYSIIIKCVNNEQRKKKNTRKHLSVAFHLVRIASQFGFELPINYPRLSHLSNVDSDTPSAPIETHAMRIFQRNGMCTIYYGVPRRV